MNNKEMLKIKYSEEFAEDYSANLDDYKDILPELADFKATVDEAVRNLIKDNPNFRGIPFEQLKNMEEFQQALKEYINKKPLPMSVLEILKSIIPKVHVKANNKLANKMTKDIVDKGKFNLVVSGKKAKKEVLTKVMLYYDENKVKLSGREKFMPYDREVHDGVISLYEAGNELITPAMVYRAMNGLTETEKISPQALETVEKSLDKAMSIKIEIDYTDEAKLYNKSVEETTFTGHLLTATKTRVKINGEVKEAFRIYAFRR